MFRLEKLEIAGFKSFVDRTTLLFGEGITGVVGPNGCGKSNIAEAISWVLGEQSAKNLRGGKMEDVIFNGTRDRKPVGMAEVLLTLVAMEDIAGTGNETPGADEGAEYDQVAEAAERAAETSSLALATFTTPHPEAVTGDGEPVQSPDTTGVESSDGPRLPARSKAHARHRRRPVLISAGERITVGRRLYRTGESDYLMNGRPCLLRDVQDLFAGTGLGGAHYAIIEQGRIGQILSSKPLDRRGLIEEAAGITRFKFRKRAAELKLESARQNLVRLNDIVSEIERQVNSLKRQAQKARRFKRLRDEMRTLQKVVFAHDYYRLTEASERVSRDLMGAKTKLRDLEAVLANREAEHRTVAAETRTSEDALAALRERAAAVELEADRARNRRTFEEQQLTELSGRIAELERDQQALANRLQCLEQEFETRRLAVESLDSELANEKEELLVRETEYQEELVNLRQIEAEIEDLRQKLLSEVGVTERLRNLGAGLQQDLRRIDLKRAGLSAELEKAVARRDELSAEHRRVGGVAERERGRVSELVASIAERSAAVQTCREEGASKRAQLDQVQSRKTAIEQRLASLEDLDRHHAYYSDAVQQVLSPDHASRINALGTLADFVDVEPPYERLVESLFSRELQCVLVPTIDDALTGINYLESEGLGRGAFMVVGLHGGEDFEDRDPDDAPDDAPGTAEPLASRRIDHQSSEADSVRFRFLFDASSTDSASRFLLDVLRAIDLLGLRPELKTVVEHAFPDRCGASVVPDIEAALHLSIENSSRIYVTYAGEQVVNGRLIISGTHALRKGTSLLGLKREIKELRAEAEAQETELEKVSLEVAGIQQQLEQIEGEALALDAELRRQEKEAASTDWQLEAINRDLERAEAHVRVVESESERSGEERLELVTSVDHLNGQLAAAESSRSALQEALAATQERLSGLRSGIEQSAEGLSSKRASLAAGVERLQAARAELRRVEQENEELRARINRNRLELYESHSRVDQLTASVSEGEWAVTRFDAEKDALVGEINGGAESVASSRLRADQIEQVLSDLRQAVANAHDERAQFQVEQARIHAEAEHLGQTCFNEIGMHIADVVTSVELRSALASPSLETGLAGQTEEGAGPDDQNYDQTAEMVDQPGPSVRDVEAVRTGLDELRRKLDEIGPINMMALEELEEAEGRLGFLSEQRHDILESIRFTEEGLDEIKRRSRDRFRHAFTHINQNFQHMFVELFGGGRGEMVLIDEEDVLESGIDLIAQPPGKRLQNVLLLSGGEKAMAAIALVLAIFQYRPSPFCILDEVDAPLDEVNVGRFAEKVVEMSRDTQFLVVTHNKRTMEAARALYGVTMEEPGISKLVSVKFE